MARALIGNAQLHANNSGYTNQPIIVWDPRARVLSTRVSDDATRRLLRRRLSSWCEYEDFQGLSVILN